MLEKRHLFFDSQSPQDHSQFWNVTTEFGEEVVLKTTLLEVVGKEFGRPRAGSTSSVWKACLWLEVCGAERSCARFARARRVRVEVTKFVL